MARAAAPAARTSPPRAERRSVALALAAALLSSGALPAGAQAASAEGERFLGQVTDALRNPATKLAAGGDGRALADLVFVDRDEDATSYRTCVRRLARGAVRACFTTVSGPADSAVITPLRFQRGRYRVTWSVAGDRVADWRFRVV